MENSKLQDSPGGGPSLQEDANLSDRSRAISGPSACSSPGTARVSAGAARSQQHLHNGSPSSMGIPTPTTPEFVFLEGSAHPAQSGSMPTDEMASPHPLQRSVSPFTRVTDTLHPPPITVTSCARLDDPCRSDSVNAMGDAEAKDVEQSERPAVPTIASFTETGLRENSKWSDNTAVDPAHEYHQPAGTGPQLSNMLSSAPMSGRTSRRVGHPSKNASQTPNVCILLVGFTEKSVILDACSKYGYYPRSSLLTKHRLRTRTKDVT